MKVISYRLEERLCKICQSMVTKAFLTFAILLEIKHLIFKEDCSSFISALMVFVMFVILYYICRIIKRVIFKYNEVGFSEISLYYIRKGEK